MKNFNLKSLVVITFAVFMMTFNVSLYANNEQIVALESQVRALEQRMVNEFSAKQQFLQQYLQWIEVSESNRQLSSEAGVSKKQRKKYIKASKSFAKKANALKKKKKIPVASILLANEIKAKKAALNEYKYIALGPVQSSRLLQQATFGPTVEEINQLTGRSAWEWLQQQFYASQTSHLALLKNRLGTDKPDYLTRIEAWWNASLHGPDQLRQRVAFALSEIFVVSEKAFDLSGQPQGMANYYDILVKHSFGNYRDLLEAVTLSPIMGVYLSHLGNEKPNVGKNIRPDENYAREILQLFSIGLVELNIDGTVKLDSEGKAIPTYGQDQITGFAHVFTGWTYAGKTAFKKNNSTKDWLSPMIAFEDYHSVQSKVILNNVVLPPNQTAYQDLSQALDNIFYHPNVGPFISKQLIQRLITSNPTPQYVARVANIFNDNGMGVRGDLKAVVQAIFLDSEARQTNGVLAYSGKIREPLLRTTHLWRVLDAYSNAGVVYTGNLDDTHGQLPLGAGSVFNFFRPDYNTQALESFGLVAPELQIANDSTLIAQLNYLWSGTMWSMAESDNGKTVASMLIKISPLVSILKQQGYQALIQYLNLVFMAGNMDENLQSVLTMVASQSTGMIPEARAGLMLYIVLISPNYITQI